MDAARGAVHDAVHTALSTPAMEALKVNMAGASH